ncbi:4'-phosphopantetheinyl transferase superfamily protein [Nonomuraea sp. NPDC003804]|uniref:4'-phosphopantetheinyl transferase family protein n=1 Tax=Nonomuraea sp. NPDC003804 TaxID=3154547 RepID=UPI0033AE1A1B
MAAAEAFHDPADAWLYPEELAAVARAVEKRRREFATVRLCARRALAALGVPPVAVVPGERGAPGWPEGVVGSMTHCPGYRASAVAFTRDVVALGLDAEPNTPLSRAALEAVTVGEERTLLAELLDEWPHVHWDKLLFSAKESVYKTWFPLAGRGLRFTEVEVVIDPGGAFAARLPAPAPAAGGRDLPELTGRWLVRDGLILTAVAVSAGAHEYGHDNSVRNSSITL